MSDASLFVSAGDPSGDNAAARLVKALRQSHPDLKLFGLGGPRLAGLGQEQSARPSELAVLGFWEVAKRYFFFRRLFHRCLDEIREKRPKAVLLVDYPGFNLRLARKIKPLGIPIIYYISPQVWAWGKRRIPLIRQTVDQMLVILPFEEQFYRDHSVACRFVGHYLMEDIPADMIGSHPPGNRVIGILPGSRPQEIERMLPTMVEAARLLREAHNTKAIIAGIRGVFDYEKVIRDAQGTDIEIVYDDSRRVIFESDIVLTASGTATLETGIIGRPMVIIYKTGLLTYLIARSLVKLKMIGLANLVIGEQVLPELIQADASPKRISSALGELLDNSDYQSKVVKRLHDIPRLLGGGGASGRAAAIVGDYL